MEKLIVKLISKRGQISIEFSILIMAVTVAALLVGKSMIGSAIEVKDNSIETINETSNNTMRALSIVR